MCNEYVSTRIATSMCLPFFLTWELVYEDNGEQCHRLDPRSRSLSGAEHTYFLVHEVIH